MPAAKDPSTDLIYMPIPILARPKGDGNDVILSPEEKSRRIAAKKAQIEARRAFDLAMLQRPIMPGDSIPASTNPVVIPAAPPEKKKPNVLLLVGVAVVGLLVIRKVLN
jgi:hypothetical protein